MKNSSIQTEPSESAKRWLISQHANVYVGDMRWHQKFGEIVSAEISNFFANFDSKTDGFWFTHISGQPACSISIAGTDMHTARIRFFVTDPQFQGRGLGKQLLNEALQFCANRKKDVYLTTVKGLDAAKHLYEQAGFTLTDEHEDLSWGSPMIEQRWERKHRAHA